MFKTFGLNLSKRVRLLRVPFLDTKWKLHHYIDGLGYIEYVGFGTLCSSWKELNDRRLLRVR